MMKFVIQAFFWTAGICVALFIFYIGACFIRGLARGIIKGITIGLKLRNKE